MSEYKFPDEQGNDKADTKVDYEVESDTEIEVVDDTPPEDRGRTPMKDPPPEVTDEELEQYGDSVRKRIQHLSKGYHEERRAKEAAQRERDEAARLVNSLLNENKKLQGTVGQGQQVLVEQAKKVAQTDLDEAKRKLKEAHEAFDTDAIIDAQEAMTAAKMRLERVSNFKPAPLQQEQNEVQTAQQSPAQAPQQLDPKTNAWMQANPWFGKNKRLTAFAMALHEELVEEGVDPRDDAYFQRIDSELRDNFPSAFSSVKKPAKASVVAPATRSTAPKKIVLTQSAMTLAKRLGLTPEQYARAAAEEMRKQNG
jgi:DNA primase catalytic subunit